jgi:hypothetical protein
MPGILITGIMGIAAVGSVIRSGVANNSADVGNVSEVAKSTSFRAKLPVLPHHMAEQTITG